MRRSNRIDSSQRGRVSILRLFTVKGDRYCTGGNAERGKVSGDERGTFDKEEGVETKKNSKARRQRGR